MFARTKRLLLRPGWAEDAANLHQAWSDEAIARNLPSLPAGHSEAATAEFLQQERTSLSPYSLIFARTGGAPRLVGGIGLLDSDTDRPELSFWVARPFWGLGFATEAAAAVLHMARSTGLPKLISRPFEGNISASNVLTKLGFHPTGRIENPRGSRESASDAARHIFEDEGFTPAKADMSAYLYSDQPPLAA